MKSIWLALLVITSMLLAGGCFSTGPSIPLSPLTVAIASKTGTSKEEVIKSLGTPHEGSEKGPIWQYVYQDKEKNNHRLDVVFGSDDKVISSRLRPCRQTRVGGQMEYKCLISGESYGNKKADF